MRIEGGHMKKHILKFYIFLTIILISFQNTYALSFEMSNTTKLVSYAICGIFIITGVIVIFVGNKNNTTKTFNYNEEKNKQKKHDDNANLTKTFSPDIILKTIPTFSNKKYFDQIFELLKKDIEQNNTIKNITILKKEIIDFKEEQNKYLITSKIKLNYIQEETKTIKEYTLLTENKTIDENITNCPICGGKIKDITKLRCKYCDSILPKIEPKTSINNWIITEIKVDQ